MSDRNDAAPRRGTPEGHVKAGEPQATVAHTTDTVTHQQLDLITLLAGPATIAERFREFHADNPHVYAVLVALTRDYVRRTGRRRVGIAAVYERARWELSLQTTETPRLNNSYRAHYARLIMAQEPDLSDVFETRTSAADQTLGKAA